MKKQIPTNYKTVLTSIVIGACVAFISSLLDGLLAFLRDNGNDIVGGGTATLTYLLKHWKA